MLQDQLDAKQPLLSDVAGSGVSLKLGTKLRKVYGINAIRLAADPSSQIANCGPKGNKGFSKPVNGNGNYTFNLKELGTGQYKFELFITRSDGVIVGHNEVFICLT